MKIILDIGYVVVAIFGVGLFITHITHADKWESDDTQDFTNWAFEGHFPDDPDNPASKWVLELSESGMVSVIRVTDDNFAVETNIIGTDITTMAGALEEAKAFGWLQGGEVVGNTVEIYPALVTVRIIGGSLEQEQIFAFIRDAGVEALSIISTTETDDGDTLVVVKVSRPPKRT